MPRDVHSLLNLAERAAHAGGRMLAGRFGGDIRILSAQGHDIKTSEDQEAESIIIKALSAESDLPVLSEERAEKTELTGGQTWVVDPIDGTFNFHRGLGFCCVSVALCEGEDPLLGVVYDFVQRRTYRGVVGGEATCNGRRIAVSGKTEREQAALATGLPVMRDYSTEALAGFIKRFQTFKKVRMIGSAAMALTLVAAGVLDVYMEEDIMIWDVAAGAALVMAAGGVVHMSPSSRHPLARHVSAAATPALIA